MSCWKRNIQEWEIKFKRLLMNEQLRRLKKDELLDNESVVICL